MSVHISIGDSFDCCVGPRVALLANPRSSRNTGTLFGSDHITTSLMRTYNRIGSF